MVSLEWPFNWNTDVVGLLLRELCELNAKLVEVEAGNFFVQVLRQTVNINLVVVLPEVELSQSLV